MEIQFGLKGTRRIIQRLLEAFFPGVFNEYSVEMAGFIGAVVQRLLNFMVAATLLKQFKKLPKDYFSLAEDASGSRKNTATV